MVGGGDTAMDCVRTAVRQGAAKVTCLYRRDRANMPGSQREVANAEEEGVEFAWLTAPRAFTGDATVAGVRVARMRLGAPDATGRQSPEEIPDADYTEPAELVIKALGFEPEELPRLWGVEGLEVTRWGTVKADFLTKRTSLEGVYAAGDIVRGASLVVWAIRDGREAAESILTWLDGPLGGGGGGVRALCTTHAHSMHIPCTGHRGQRGVAPEIQVSAADPNCTASVPSVGRPTGQRPCAAPCSDRVCQRLPPDLGGSPFSG